MELKDCKVGLPVTLLEKPHEAYVFDVGCSGVIHEVGNGYIRVKVSNGVPPRYKNRPLAVQKLHLWAILENKE